MEKRLAGEQIKPACGFSSNSPCLQQPCWPHAAHSRSFRVLCICEPCFHGIRTKVITIYVRSVFAVEKLMQHVHACRDWHSCLRTARDSSNSRGMQNNIVAGTYAAAPHAAASNIVAPSPTLKACRSVIYWQSNSAGTQRAGQR